MPVSDKEYYKGLEFRIAELERKLLGCSNYDSEQLKQWEKLKELENWKDKSWNMHQQMAQDILPNQIERLEKTKVSYDQYMIHELKISELKESLGKKGVASLGAKENEEAKDNIDSNREQINANLDGINYCRKFMFNLEEVLRKTLERLSNIFDFSINNSQFFEYQLAKLDGSPKGKWVVIDDKVKEVKDGETEVDEIKKIKKFFM